MTTDLSKKRNRKSCILALTLFLTFALTMVFPKGVSYANIGATGQFDLDVIFVIDVSGSMLEADPDRLAATAANLFIDMTEGSDSRAGYVMFNDTIAMQRELTDLISFSRDVKRSISSMVYGGFTDIWLGLQTAIDMFADEAAAGRDNRTPVIILLGDGNTHLREWGATETDAVRQLREEAHADIIHYLGSDPPDIPIFSIGFNFDGSLDMELFTGVAELTGGSVFETSSAAELPGILRNIYSELTGARSIPIFVGEATGMPQSFTIPISNQSIYRAVITIMSSQPVQDVYFAHESGRTGNYTINADEDGRYTLITLIRPEMGDWTLTFTGTVGDTISIDLLSIYNINLVLDLPRTSVGLVEFSWRLEDELGNNVDDPDLIEMLDTVLHFRNIETGAETIVNFEAGQTEMSLPFEPGEFEAYLTLDSDGIVRTSNVQPFTVPAAAPLSLTESVRAGGGAVEISLMTIFNTETSIILADIIEFADENLPLAVVAAYGNWEEYVDFNFSSLNDLITLTALNAGATDIAVSVTDPHGHNVEFFIEVNIFNGLIPIIVAAVVLLIIVAVLIIIFMGKKPRLNDPISRLPLRMTLPANVHSATPPEAILTLPPLKGKKTLRELINMNMGITEPYGIAFETISWFADQTVFSARSKNELEIRVPSNPGYVVKIDKLAGKPSVILTGDGGTEIRIGYDGGGDYSEYVIIFGNTDRQRDSGQQYGQPFGRDDGFLTGGGRDVIGGQGQSNAEDSFW